MAAVVPTLFRRSTALRIATNLNQLSPSFLVPNLSSCKQPQYIDRNSYAPEWLVDRERTKIPFSRHPSFAYPSFPFGCILDPVPLFGIKGVEDIEDARTVWADSVKKKRKKKMNKHKYKKLRKVLRRKS